MKFLWGMPYTTVPSGPTKTLEEAMMRKIGGLNLNVIWSGKPRRSDSLSWSWTGWVGGTVSLERLDPVPTKYDCHIQVELSSGALISLEELQLSRIPPSPYLHIEGRSVPIYLRDWTPPTSEDGKYQIMSCHLYAWTQVDDGRYRISMEPHGFWSVQEHRIQSAKQYYALAVSAGMDETTSLRVLVLEPFGDHYEVFGNGYYGVEKPDSEYGVVEGGSSAAAVDLLPRRSFRVG